MSDHLKLHDDGGDSDVTRLLREAYAPPAGDAYWRDLEARILSHVASAPVYGWWDELDHWMRPALVAAAVVLLAAGVAMFRGHQVEQEATYEAMRIRWSRRRRTKPCSHRRRFPSKPRFAPSCKVNAKQHSAT
jgi:hypothetical protein